MPVVLGVKIRRAEGEDVGRPSHADQFRCSNTECRGRCDSAFQSALGTRRGREDREKHAGRAGGEKAKLIRLSSTSNTTRACIDSTWRVEIVLLDFGRSDVADRTKHKRQL